MVDGLLRDARNKKIVREAFEAICCDSIWDALVCDENGNVKGNFEDGFAVKEKYKKQREQAAKKAEDFLKNNTQEEIDRFCMAYCSALVEGSEDD